MGLMEKRVGMAEAVRAFGGRWQVRDYPEVEESGRTFGLHVFVWHGTLVT